MPNVLFTQKCVRSCPYCFADRHMSESAPQDVISWENLIYVADFLRASGEQRFHILGGEPTLHPEFVDMVLYLLERQFDITVFTSGVMSDDQLEQASAEFRNLPEQRLAFVCNLNDPEKTRSPPAEMEAVKRFLRHFGERTVPGFNIYRLDFELDFLFQHINEFGLKRTIRLGLTHPIAGRRNRFIAIGDIDVVIDRLFSFAPKFDRLRIKPGLDCGFPMCRFSAEQLGWLYRVTGGQYDFGCAPVVDIGPDLNLWACFPLSGFHQRSLLEFDSLRQVREYYMDLHKKIRVEVAGLYEECDHCVSREDRLCKGGCIAHSLARFGDEVPLRQSEVYT